MSAERRLSFEDVSRKNPRQWGLEFNIAPLSDLISWDDGNTEVALAALLP